MAKKDKNAKAAKKARGAEKAAKAAKKAEKKTQKRDGDDEEDVDIDTILAEYARKQAEFEKVTIKQVPKPSKRQNPTLIVSPSTRKELILFGGEQLDSNTGYAQFFNDLYTYSIDNDTWRLVSSPNSPLARCGHAMCPHPSGIVLMHGGEFSSPKQTSFHHYSDTWILDASSKEWTQVESRPSPSPRSGHRMCVWKNYILLFGGFRDLSASTTYLDDLWAFDVLDYKWHKIEIPQALAAPDARSGHSFIPCAEGAVLYGGYSKVKGKKGIQKGKIHADTWLLRMKQDLKSVRWERRKKGSYMPSPRIGCSLVPHHGRGAVMFGGVYDTDETEEELRSVFYNQLYSYNLESNRWYPLSLRAPRRNMKAQAGPSKSTTEQKQEELNEILKKLNIDIDEMLSDEEEEEEDEGVVIKEYPVVSQLPHPRFNASLAVVGDTLFIYGGIWEDNERELSFDSFYSLDLGRLDGLKVYWEELGLDETSGKEESDGEEDDTDDESRGDSDEESEAEEEEEEEEEIEEEEEEEESITEGDPRPWLPHPKPFETITAFYRKNVNDFVEWALKSSPDSRGKDLKRVAFELAQSRWWERRDAVVVLEDQLQEAGIEDVVEREQKRTSRR